jgi:hypothetical protein
VEPTTLVHAVSMSAQNFTRNVIRTDPPELAPLTRQWITICMQGTLVVLAGSWSSTSF